MFSFNIFHRFVLSGFVLLSLTCKFSFATENAKSSALHEVGLAVPWKHFDGVLRGEFPADRIYNYDYDNLTFVAQDVPFVIPKTKLSVLFNMQPGEFKDLGAAWNMNSLSIKIETSPFKVEKTIVENVGGVIVNVKLNAECLGITLLQHKADARVGVAIATNGSEIESKVTDMTFHWGEPWWVDTVTCEGPRGFGELIAQELRLKLADPAAVESLVRDTLQVQMQKQIQALLNKAMIPQVVYGQGNRQIVLKYKKVESLPNIGLLVVANLDIPGSEVAPGNAAPTTVPLVLTSSDLAQVHDKPVLFLPQTAFIESTRAALTSYVFRGDLTDFPSFQSLMKSRFIQFFVWPDLRKYPKDSKFPFVTRMQQLKTLAFDKGLKVKLGGTVESWLQSNRGGAQWNYLYTGSELSTDATISVANGVLNLSLKDTKLKSKAQMYPEYVTKFKPSKSISTSIIDGAIKGSVLSKGLDVTLPVFKVNANEYKATQVFRSSAENLAVAF